MPHSTVPEPSSQNTLTFGQRLTLIRKRRGLTQNAVGEAVGTSGDIVGKYEREEMRPSIEVASRLADALGVSLDYLAGRSEALGDADPKTIQRLREIGQLGDEERERVYLVVDALLRDFRARGIYES